MGGEGGDQWQTGRQVAMASGRRVNEERKGGSMANGPAFLSIFSQLIRVRSRRERATLLVHRIRPAAGGHSHVNGAGLAFPQMSERGSRDESWEIDDF